MKKRGDSALFSFLKQSLLNVNSLISKTSKALSFLFFIKELRVGNFYVRQEKNMLITLAT